MKDIEAATPVETPVTAEWLEARRAREPVDAQDDDLALVFPIEVPDDTFASYEHMAVRYPFTFGGDEPLYHDIVIHLARDYIHHTSDQIDPIDTHCDCGEDLGYEPDHNHYQRWLAIRHEFTHSCILHTLRSPTQSAGTSG